MSDVVAVITGPQGPPAYRPVQTWTTGQVYSAPPYASTVMVSGTLYECLIAHTAGAVFSTDYAAGKWGKLVEPGFKTWLPIAADYSATPGDRLQCNTTAGNITVTMPASPTEGTEVWIYTYGGNSVALARNGSTFNGIADDILITIDDVELHLVLRNSTWRY